MGLFQTIGQGISEVLGSLGEKSRRAAYLSRIRTVIRSEEHAAEKQYLALGRYYYHNLRDKNDPVTEAHCAELDEIETRLESALSQLDLFYQLDQAQKGEVGIIDREDGSIGVISGEDGPTAVFISEPSGDGAAEEITLDDVQCYDSDPTEAADPAENDDLPFEG